MYTHRTWEPENDLNTEDGLVSELLLLAAQYHNSASYQQSTGESTPRPLGAKKGCSVEEFLKAALKGDRIAMPIPGAGILLHTADFAKAVGSWDSDRDSSYHTCKRYEPPVQSSGEIGGCGFRECVDTGKACEHAVTCEQNDLHYENKRFGKDIPRELSKIVDYVVSGKAEEDRARETEEAEAAKAAAEQ
ncbi:hypothetical protein KY326_00335 [Candidatus Woesearchaeota archaeon]|nr:hypothetical protein [Candidatus Woesearchaeota archaeon]